MLNILVSGANGRMGQHVIKAVNQDQDLNLKVQANSHAELVEALNQHELQVAIDFTTPKSVYANTLAIIAAKVCPVIGTSGLSKEQISEIKKRCLEKKLGGIFAPNFAIPMVLMQKFAKKAREYFNDCSIIEYHHAQKKDRPSATALATQEILGKETPISSIRSSGVVANQEIIFGAPGQTMTLAHHTTSRDSFMPGVLLACKQVVKRSNFIVGLEHFIS